MYFVLSALQSDLISLLGCLYFCLLIKSDLPFNFLLSSFFSNVWSDSQCCLFPFFLPRCLSSAVINTSLALFAIASGSSSSILTSTEYSLATASKSSEWDDGLLFVLLL